MSEQRKQLYIKRSFQKTMILETLLMTFIIINVIVVIGYLMINTMADVQALKQSLAYIVTAIEVISFIWMYRYNLKASHRIAGPIYNLERGMAALAVGDLSVAIRLRKGDSFQEVGDQMNATIGKLREKITDVQHLAMQLQEGSSVDAGLVNQLVDELAYFQTEPDLSNKGEDSTDSDGEK